jgi:3-keto-disaccharide hydrolase
MKSRLHTTFFGLLVLLAARHTAVADDAGLMAARGKLLFEDDFAREEMAPKWAKGLGFWTVKDGVATAAENPEDHHGAYAFITPNIDYKDVVAEFEFKLNGASDLVLNMRDQRYNGAQAGHILRATIMKQKYQLADMKLGGMKWENYNVRKDPKATPEAKKAVEEAIKDKTATFPATIDHSTWHQARAEVVGDELLLLIDGKPVAYLRSGGIDHPTKNMLGFSIVGKTASIRNPKFWAATANPAWPGKRAEIVAGILKSP